MVKSISPQSSSTVLVNSADVIPNLIICVFHVEFRNYQEYLFVAEWGFGFITFGDPASVDKVLAQGTHELDGKKVSEF
ncbi:unnamed protein product [Pieris macdunnoughi]|uniref:Uncharacterized protein n=1 Tax=Pieris macdunnoughi TaxID=345717 RepID=A0A821MV14_9NEOP|nr:unnamed protein product [Pieris macdunnoughi]